jgi:hypothetical protein
MIRKPSSKKPMDEGDEHQKEKNQYTHSPVIKILPDHKKIYNPSGSIMALEGVVQLIDRSSLRRKNPGLCFAFCT